MNKGIIKIYILLRGKTRDMIMDTDKKAKKEDTYTNFTISSIAIFHIFETVNIVTLARKKIANSLIRNILYIIIPILIYAGNIYNMISSNVLYGNSDKFTYINDLSNSLGLTLLYFLSYFLSGYYPQKFNEWMCFGIKADFKNNVIPANKKNIILHLVLLVIGVSLLGVGIASGYAFYSAAGSNKDAYWINNLSQFGRIYYCIFLGLTWYQSLSLLGMAISGGFTFFWSIKAEKILYIEEYYNKNDSIIKMVDILISNFSYGLFYIVGSILFILNDKVAEKNYGIKNTFYEDKPAFFLIVIVLILVILVYVPLQELLHFMKIKKEERIQDISKKIDSTNVQSEKNNLIKQRNDVVMQGLIYTSLGNKLVIVLSILIPLIGVILQGIELFIKPK